MKLKIKLHFALIFVFFVLSGCGHVHRAVNEKWPPLTTKDQQLSAINEANVSLSKMDNLDLAIFINETDFKHLATEAFKNYKGKLIGKTLGKVTIDSLGVPEIDLKLQGVFVATNFEITIDEYKTKLSGSVSGISALSSTDKQVNIRPSLTYLQLNKLPKDDEQQLINRLGKNAAIALVNDVLKSFLDNLNGAYLKDPVSIPIDLAFAKLIKSGDIVGSGDLNYSSGADIPVNISLSSFVPFINEQGVMLMASRKQTTKVATPEGTSNDLVSKFKQYSDNASYNITTYLGESMVDLIKTTSIIFNKAFVSDTLNSSLGDLDITLQKNNFIKLPEDKRSFQKEVRIGSARLPDCGGLRHECRRDECNGPCRTDNCQNCTPHHFPYIPNPVCLASSAACQAGNVARRAGCAVCRTAAVASMVECRAENEVRVAACIAEREVILRPLGDLMHLVDLSGEFNVTSSTVRAHIKKVSFKNDLSSLTISSNINADANTWLRLHVNPRSIAHLACVFPFTRTLDTSIHGGLNSPDVTLKINPQEQADGALILNVLSTSQTLDLALNPSPFNQLVSDPLFVLNCSFLTMAMSAVAGEELLRRGDIPSYLKPMFGEVSYEIKPQEFKFPIKPISIGKDNFAITVKPKWRDKTIDFTRF
jgi:hypothetical protein